MSTTVDQRVVEMRFDNRQFEKNVSTTMSTLDKLKQKLNFKGAANSLETVNTAAKKVNMSGLNNAVDTVHAKFSALQVMGVTALANITNSAVNAGKRIVSALTIDPVRSGFQEYETQINAVQTILANTQHEGKNINDVNKALDELNKYADQTIYNFTEMTRNIGTFTAAGVNLDTSVSAIKGIANLAAVSGSTSQQASTAMYQLSQALAAGRVSLQDWNSVVNAGMGGKVFQDALTRTARVMGTGVDADIKKYGSFRESLSRGGWLTTEVLTETLNQFTMSAKEGSEEWNNFMAALQKKGYTKEQATEILKMANTATDAATKIKTFTQLWDVMKETAQSGWSQTWKLIFGDFEEAREMFTRLSKPILGFIEGMGNARNAIINSAFSKNFKGVVDSIKNIAKPAKEAVKTVEDLGKIVNKVINGDFGNGKKRFDELTKSGINYYRVQNQVNEKLGNTFRYTEDQIKAQDKLLGKQKDSTKATKEQSEATAEYIADLTKLSDAQLKELGYNEKQIESIRELTKLSEKLGIPVKELVENIDKIDGRWLFIESFANVGKSFMTVAKSIGQAWKDIFPSTAKDKGNTLFEIIAGLHRISRGFLESTNDNAGKLKRTFKGLFAIVDILTTILGGGFKIAFKIVSSILKAFNLNILDATAYVGDAIVRFRDFLDGALDFTDIFKKMKPYLVAFGKAVREAFVKSAPYLKKFGSFLKDKLADAIPYLKQFAIYIKDAFVAAVPYIKAFARVIKDGFVALKNSKFAEIAKDCLLGFKDGLVSGIKGLWEFIKGIASKVLDTFSEMLGVQSPSWKFFAIAAFCIAGFLNGLKASGGNVWEALKLFGQKCIDIIKGIDIGSIIALIVSSGIAIAAVKIAKAIESVGDFFGGFADVADSLAGAFDGLKKVFKSFSLLLQAKALKEVAISIAILAGSIFVLALIPKDKLWGAVGALAVIAGIVAALMGIVALIAKFSADANKNLKDSAKATFSIAQIGFSMLSMAGSLLLIAFALKVASGVDWERGKAGLIALGVALAAMAATLILYAKFAKVGSKATIDKAGVMLLKMSFALLIVAGVLKLASSIDVKNGLGGMIALGSALIVMGAILVLYGLLANYGAASNIDKVGGMLIKMASSLLILAIAIKLISNFKWADSLEGMSALALMIGAIVGLMAATRLIKPGDISGIGGTLLAVSGAIAILAITMKLLSGFSWKEDLGALTAIAALGAIIAGLIWATSLAGGKDLKGVGTTLLFAAGAIAILAGIAVVLGYVKPEKLTQGVIAVGVLGAIIGGLIWVTKYAQDCKGDLIAISVAIGILAISVAALSLINWKKLAPAVGGMALLMGMFALMTYATSNAKSCIGNLITMSIAVGLMATIIYILAQLPWESTLASSAGLSLLLLTISGCLMILSHVGKSGLGALAGVGLLFAMVFPLDAFVSILSRMSGIENAQTNTLVLVTLATSLTMLLAALSAIGTFLGLGAIIGVGLLIAMAVPLVAFVAILAWMENLQNAEANARMLIGLVTTMTQMLVILAIVGPLAIVGVAAMTALTLLMVSVGALAIAIGALMEKFPQLEEFLNRGLPILNKLAFAIGSFVGNLIKGFAVTVMSTLPIIGTYLSQFMVAAIPFIAGAKLVDEQVLEGVKILAGAILLLTAADLINNIASFATGGFSLPALGAQLSMFMISAMPFITAANMLKPESMEGVKSLAEAIMILTAADLVNGIKSFLSGGDSTLSAFGKELEPFGKSIAAFATSVCGLDENALNAMKVSAEAGKALAEMAKTIPNSGGWLSKIMGDNKADDFGSQLKKFGSALKSYGESVTDINVDAINTSVSAAKSLSELAKSVPNSGGWLATIAGDNGMASFGKELTEFGKSLKSYGISVTDINTEAISNSVSAAKSLTDIANAVPKTGGWLSVIAGDNGMASFGKELKSFGSALKGYGTNVSDLNVDAIANSVKATNSLVELANAAPKLGGLKSLWSGDNSLKKFGKELKSFAGYLEDYSDGLSKVSTSKIGGATTQLNRLINMAKDAEGVDFGGLKSFGEALKKLGKSGVDKFIEAFEDADKRVKEAGKGMMDSLVKGAEGSAKNLSAVFAKIVNGTLTSIKTYRTNFYDAGAYLVSGFASGISSNTYMAKAKARAMAKAAAKAAEDELDINSPSKVAYSIGSFFGMGFVTALNDYRDAAYVASADIAKSANDGMNDAISKAGDLMFGEVDTQPTIRPVVDLTDVRNSSGLIADMFNGTHHLNAVAAVGSVGYMMNHRIQNGNDDVVSAINKLGKGLGNLGNTTNIVNGVTYDDGSNISDTVKALIRQARIERRV